MSKKTTKIKSPLEYLKAAQARLKSSQYSYLAFSFILPVFIMYLVYVGIGIHPFGEESVLVLDLNGQYVSFFEALRNFVKGDASLLYSFSRSLGGEYMGIYAYYIASPLSYIVALFPTERMLEALLVLILLKVGLAGVSFGFYLHKNSKTQNKYIIIAFSILYSLCSYAITYQENTMWMDALIWLPLIVYGIEQLVKFKKYKLFVISLALCVASNFYIGYMVCIFVAIYFFWYCYSQKNETINPLGEKRHFLRAFLRIAAFSLLSLAIAAAILLPAYYSLTLGKTGFSNPSWAFEENFKILDFFTKFLPGTYDSVSYGGLPLVYAGILMLLLVPAYFATKKISSREKLASLVVIIFFIFSFIARPLDLIWHGFQFPNWLNHRYSFLLVFFLLTLAYKAVGNLKRLGVGFLIGTGSLIVIFAAVCQKLEFESYIKTDSKLLSLETIWLTIIVTVILVALLCLLSRVRDKLKREGVSCAILALVCVEIFCSTLTCFVYHNKELVYSNYDPYNDYFRTLRPVVEQIKENDASFYRFEKTDHRKSNDNMTLGIRGLSNSTSTLNASTIKFLKRLGYAADAHWSKYLGNNPVSDSLLGVKYVMNKGSSSMLDGYYDVVYTGESYTTYKNERALSIAYGVDKAVRDLDLSQYNSSFDISNAIVAAMLGDESSNLFVPIAIESTSPENCSRKTGYADGYVKYETTSSSSAGSITFNITAVTNDEIFIYIPSSYQRESKLTVNGSSKGTIFAKESRRIISLGKYTPGESLTVKITFNNDYDNIFIIPCDTYFYYLDAKAYEKAFDTLTREPQFIVNDGATDDCLEGAITTTEASQMIQTTIPYDEGWQIYLDGENVEYYETLDALIAFDINNAGEHTLVMKYRSNAVVFGAIISLAGILVFIALCIIEFIAKRKGLLRECTVSDTPWALEDLDPDTYDEKETNDFLSVVGQKLSKYFKKDKKCNTKKKNGGK